MCAFVSAYQNTPSYTSPKLRRFAPTHIAAGDDDTPALIPGLPDAVAATCLALVDRSSLHDLTLVSRTWRSFIVGGELDTVRESLGLTEDLLYVLVGAGDRKQWQVLDSSGRKARDLPLMPGPSKAAFGLAVLGDKLIVAGGYSVAGRVFSPSSKVFQFDPRLNSWTELPEMNVARYNFACAAVNGKVYSVGGYGGDGYSLSSAEVYDPRTNRWTFTQRIRRPRYSAFAFGFKNRLYVIGGRSSSTVGSADYVEIYDPDFNTWHVDSGSRCGSTVGSASAAVGNKTFCLDWKDPRVIRVFDPEDRSWETIRIPTVDGGSTCLGFRVGAMDGKLLLFPREPGEDTLCYDPKGSSGSGWEISAIKPGGPFFASATVKG